MGPQPLKNIAEPMQAWRVRLEGQSPSKEQSGSAANEPEALALPDKPSIAVLPFQNMSADPEQEYFADGLVEDIITALSRFKLLFVIARNSSFTYKGKAVDIKQVGRELGVRYVLEGSVRKAGTRLRITGQLIEASTGAHLWAEKIDGALEDVFDLQDRITASVVGVIAPKIEQAEIERANQKPTDRLDSYDHYLRAVALYNKRMFAAARPLFEKAYELDPQCAAAYAGAAATIAQQQGTDGITLTAEMRAEAVKLELRENDQAKSSRPFESGRIVRNLLGSLVPRTIRRRARRGNLGYASFQTCSVTRSLYRKLRRHRSNGSGEFGCSRPTEA
jgi:TolB-like protein